jgi:SAM-dependent methyltransferase
MWALDVVVRAAAGWRPRAAMASSVTAMAERDRRRWDQRYATQGPPQTGAAGPPDVLARHADIFPTEGRALDLACGPGLGAVWLARLGLRVRGVDISAVAIRQAGDLARLNGVADRCHFEVVDLDAGLPDGPPVDVILCHKFRARRLDPAIVGRLAPGGLLAIAALSEVGAAPGPFPAVRGELPAAFAELAVIAEGEGRGYAWLLARA